MKGPRHVRDVHEIASLRPVADDRKGLSGELLRQENAEHRPISAGGPGTGPVSVEDANRIDRESIDPSPMQYRFFPHVFAQRVGILRPDGRLFRRGNFLRQAVARGRRGIDQLADFRVARRFQNLDRAHHVG